MENRDYFCELYPPPSYSVSNNEHLKEEIEFLNISSQQSQTTVVTMTEIPPVRDHVIWSMFNTMYLNFFCLGLLALVFSIKARDQKVQGDERAARLYGRKARCYNILATIWNITLPAMLLALFITGIVHLSQVVNASIDFFNFQSYMGSTEDDNK